jgi:uncharacterized protein (DUF433 family)
MLSLPGNTEPNGLQAQPERTHAKMTDSMQDYREHIVRDPAICGGQPIIRGTRVLVRTILGYLANGETSEAVRRDFPTVSENDVRAVIAFAATAASEDLPAPGPIPSEGRAA